MGNVIHRVLLVPIKQQMIAHLVLQIDIHREVYVYVMMDFMKIQLQKFVYHAIIHVQHVLEVL